MEPLRRALSRMSDLTVSNRFITDEAAAYAVKKNGLEL